MWLMTLSMRIGIRTLVFQMNVPRIQCGDSLSFSSYSFHFDKRTRNRQSFQIFYLKAFGCSLHSTHTAQWMHSHEYGYLSCRWIQKTNYIAFSTQNGIYNQRMYVDYIDSFCLLSCECIQYGRCDCLLQFKSMLCWTSEFSFFFSCESAKRKRKITILNLICGYKISNALHWNWKIPLNFFKIDEQKFERKTKKSL